MHRVSNLNQQSDAWSSGCWSMSYCMSRCFIAGGTSKVWCWRHRKWGWSSTIWVGLDCWKSSGCAKVICAGSDSVYRAAYIPIEHIKNISVSKSIYFRSQKYILLIGESIYFRMPKVYTLWCWKYILFWEGITMFILDIEKESWCSPVCACANTGLVECSIDEIIWAAWRSGPTD